MRCNHCPHNCLLPEGKTGICLTRKNIDGKIVPLNLNRPVASAIDPIEKKPLFHFYPGSEVFSMGPSGCSMKCSFCQNHNISQQVHNYSEVNMPGVIQNAAKYTSIAYTFTEPYMWFETIMHASELIKEQGLNLKQVMVTNGYTNPGPFKELLGVIDAMNIDIKSMNPQFYKTVCKAELQPVLRSCVMAKVFGCHLEISNLIIPGMNDSDEDIRNLAKFIKSNLGKDTPLHLAKYFPNYRMDIPPTPTDNVFHAQDIAREYLNHVYIGNIETDNDTICPRCKKILIHRRGYTITKNEPCNCGKVTIIGG
jgi:pyruvate formate lyase activating enzyme